MFPVTHGSSLSRQAVNHCEKMWMWFLVWPCQLEDFFQPLGSLQESDTYQNNSNSFSNVQHTIWGFAFIKASSAWARLRTRTLTSLTSMRIDVDLMTSLQQNYSYCSVQTRSCASPPIRKSKLLGQGAFKPGSHCCWRCKHEIIVRLQCSHKCPHSLKCPVPCLWNWVQ